MSQSQKYISILLERLPKWELRSIEHQTNLDQIRERLSSAANLREELETLYQVKGFSDFALSLMWIAEKVERDPSMGESTPDEETLVFSKFNQAIGETPEPSSPMFEFPSSPGFGPAQMTTQEPASSPMMADTQQPFEPFRSETGDTGLGRDQEQSFARLLERFLESVQSGNDDRSTLASEVVNECNTVAAASVGEDYRQFCLYLVEFLSYIIENQYLDDVRVMNIISNILDPFSQWARSIPEDRAGVLDQANYILRDFRPMFE